MTFQAFRGPSGAQIAFTILLATSIGDKMLYSDTVYCSQQEGRQRGNGWSKWWKVKYKVAINSNFRIGAKISAQMHNRSSVLRNLSQICDIWQFSMNPHTPRVYEKLPNIPNIASVSQNRLTREKYFSLLWIFFWVFPKKNVMWFVSQNIFWRHITQT